MTTEHIDAPPTTAHLHDRVNLAVVGVSALVLSASLWVETPESPEPGASAARIRSFFEANLDQIGLAVMSATVGFGALLVMTVGLWRLVAARGDGQSFAAVMLLLSGALTSLWLAVAGAVDLVPVVAADEAGKLSAYSDQTLLTLDLVNRLGETFGDVSTVSRGFFLLSVGLLVVRHRVLPRWIGHFAMVIGAASLIGIVATAMNGGIAVLWLVGLFGFVLWVLILAIASLVALLWSRPQRSSL
ncbi:MAG: hypothetical protein ABIW17_07785 [Marmoricola sp.]